MARREEKPDVVVRELRWRLQSHNIRAKMLTFGLFSGWVSLAFGIAASTNVGDVATVLCVILSLVTGILSFVAIGAAYEGHKSDVKHWAFIKRVGGEYIIYFYNPASEEFEQYKKFSSLDDLEKFCVITSRDGILATRGGEKILALHKLTWDL